MKHFITIFLLALTACSSDEAPPPPPAVKAPSNLNLALFLRRGSLVSSDFEQYTIQKNSLFAECGIMQGEKKVVLEDTLIPLADKDLDKLTYLVNQVSETKAKLEPRGSGRGIFDPGVYQLTINSTAKKRDIITSLDVVRNATESLEGALREIAERTRGIVEKKQCGNQVFYGIRKRG